MVGPPPQGVAVGYGEGHVIEGPPAQGGPDSGSSARAVSTMTTPLDRWTRATYPTDRSSAKPSMPSADRYHATLAPRSDTTSWR